MLYGFPLRPRKRDAYTRVTDAKRSSVNLTESYKNPIKFSALCIAILEKEKKKTELPGGVDWNLKSKAGKVHVLALSCNVLAIHIPGSFPFNLFHNLPANSVLAPMASNFWATSVAGQLPPPSSTH